MTAPLTPSQTIGPFFDHALPWPDGPFVVPRGTPGAFWLRGQVFDGAGEPVPDALVESWQADPAGLRGFGRCPTDDEGRFRFWTVKTGPAAPHVALSVFARGLLDRVVTRVYFPDETEANAADPILAAVDEAHRVTLVARESDDGYTFDIRLQGPQETVFFDV